MNNLAEAEKVAEKIRQEPYSLFKSNCVTKSIRFQRECRALGIAARVAVCIGLARARWFGHWVRLLVVHSWGEVEGKRIETSRPLGSSGIWGIIPMNIRPLITVRF